jgi:hypothetical protein
MAREDILRRNRDVEIRHPNREKPESNTARVGTAALLAISALMMLIIAVGGWSVMTNGRTALLGFIVLYSVFAYLVWIWNRGVLPVATGGATMLLIFALLAGPQWFSREHPGFDSPALPEPLLGTLTLALVPIQMLLIVISVWAFTQEWNVEEEVPRSSGGEQDAGPRRSPPQAGGAAAAR